MTVRRAVVAAVVATGALCGGTAPAHAYYGSGAAIVSADLVRLEEGDDLSSNPDIATAGRYVAFQTRARNFFADDDPDPAGRYRVGGIFRRDLDSGAALALVADGDQRDEQTNDLVARGAANPSTSADGRYVAFSTGQSLVPADQNGNIDVYVRDTAVSATQTGAFDLVSARTGGDVPAAYAPRAQPSPNIDPGSEVTPATSISDDGRYVLFRTVAASNLPAAAGTTTAASQLFLRDRTANTTTLVTRTTTAGDPAGGALGAALSADGTTVAWTGRNAAAQTRFLPGETDTDFPYYLWRRMADGAGAPTRRITGPVDLDDPGCAPGTTVSQSGSAQGPCYGPLTDTENLINTSISDLVPTLSGDGRRVAFLTGAGPRPNGATPEGLDLWVTSMAAGLSRKQASTELTREARPGDPPVDSVASSPDGRYLALTSQRNQFVLPALQPTGDFRSTSNQREMYVVDLDARTIERGVRNVNGGDISGSIDLGATLSSGATRVAFSTSTPDLFFGDANNRRDAFVVSRQPEPSAEAPPPPPPSGVPDAETVERTPGAAPRLSAKAKARAGGLVEITASAPAAGSVKATAKATVGSGKRKRTVTLVTATVRARKRGTVRIRLRPVQRYRPELRRRNKIAARVTVQYVAAKGNRRLSRSLRVTFVQKFPRARKKR